jgi:hypothetical protein
MTQIFKNPSLLFAQIRVDSRTDYNVTTRGRVRRCSARQCFQRLALQFAHSLNDLPKLAEVLTLLQERWVKFALKDRGTLRAVRCQVDL